MLLVFGLFAAAIGRRRLDDLGLLAATVCFALLGNAVICGVISGPHDRYGARLAWVATLVVLIAAVRHFASDKGASDDSLVA
jgi:peptidoglycan/LPS O-acetylase OafA/YrhL